jgi:homocitrate synthase
MSTANNPISHHTSHTLANGASSSNNGIHGDGAHPIRHHTSHTLENGASSSNKGAHGDGENSNDNGGSMFAWEEI